MKKTVFDLSFNEGKKIDKELHKTSYYKQYVRGYGLCTLLTLIIGCDLIGAFDKSVPATMVMIGFVSVNTLLFLFKRFDLVKEYYETKKEEEK